MSCILGVNWVTKIKVGPLIFVVWCVWSFAQDWSMVPAKCCSPFEWFGGNQKTNYPNVTFV